MTPPQTLHAPPDPDLWADHIATVRAWEAEVEEPVYPKCDEELRLIEPLDWEGA